MRQALSWMLPPGASTFVGEIDWLYYLILVITGIAFVLVELALVYFLFKYRARPGRKAVYLHGSNKAEVAWTSITAIVVVMIGVLSAPAWGRIKGRDAPPKDAIPMALTAKQFEWHFTYPGRDGKIGTSDDYTIRSQLHVPINKPVVVTMQSEDVIHSFFIPSFRIKQDAVPGMHIRVWFQPTKEGTYELGCAELCGLGHYRMRAVVTVHSQQDYDRWAAQQSAAVAQR
jgi:cytochrome c oxidase subunit II